MADKAPQKKESTAKKFTFRGLSLEQLIGLKQEQVIELLGSKQRRRFRRSIKHKYNKFVAKLRKAKSNLQPGDKPNPVKTHMRDAIILPEMVGSVVGIYTGKEFANVEIKFDMIGSYLAEFALSYKPTSHGKPGVGATKGSAHTALK
jgi:small subunit ribosomal protein S15e